MKRDISHIFLIISLCLVLVMMLFHADWVIVGAHTGLQLWYTSVLPSIFPFMIITTLLLNHIQSSNICILGLVCGLPVGANLVNQQYKSGSMPARTANILLCICNITSPMFICGYIWNQSFQKQISLLYFLLIIYIPMAIYGSICYLFMKMKRNSHFTGKKNASTEKSDSITAFHSNNLPGSKQEQTMPQKQTMSLESILLHCLKIIFLVGIYIMLFCIFIQFALEIMPSHWTHAKIAASFLEITNGIQLIHQLPLPLQQKTALIAGLTSFGGICSIFQTKSVLTESELSMIHYTISKIILGVASYLLGILIPMP